LTTWGRRGKEEGEERKREAFAVTLPVFRYPQGFFMWLQDRKGSKGRGRRKEGEEN